MSKIPEEELLKIIKDGFEEQKQIKILSLWIDDEHKVRGVYILPLQQSLSFNQEPLLNMSTDLDGNIIIIEELGEILLRAYSFASIIDYFDLIHDSKIDINDDTFNELISLCKDNPPLQRMSINLIDWLQRTDEVTPERTRSFNKLCRLYKELDTLDVDTDLCKCRHDDVYILNQFNEAAEQLRNKNHTKISELIIHNINQLYIRMQVDLYMTDDKNTIKT